MPHVAQIGPGHPGARRAKYSYYLLLSWPTAIKGGTTAMFRRLLLVGIAIAALALAAASTASAGDLVAKITYSNGAPCGSGSCEFIAYDATKGDRTQIGQTFSLVLINWWCGISYPDGNTYVCPISPQIRINAEISPHPDWSNGDSIHAYGRQACPGGGYHFSPYHSWPFNSNYGWWGGTFQLGSGCQTAPLP